MALLLLPALYNCLSVTQTIWPPHFLLEAEHDGAKLQRLEPKQTGIEVKASCLCVVFLLFIPFKIKDCNPFWSVWFAYQFEKGERTRICIVLIR